MSDKEQPPATVLQRMTAAGVSEERAREHITRGAVRLDGESVTDPDTSAPWPARVVVASV